MAVATRLSRRTLERSGMTHDEEIALLIQEQAEDDVPFVETERWSVSLDAPAPGSFASGGDGTVGGELVGRDPWSLVDDAIDLGLDPAEVAYAGDLVDAMPPPRGLLRGRGLIDRRDVPHGTAGGYQNHRCRCVPCTTAWATYKRARRAVSRDA